MSKKIGLSFLAFTILVPMLNVGVVQTAYATETVTTAPCTSLEECRELQRDTRDNIAEIIEEEEKISEYISELQEGISDLRDQIADLEERISDLESEIEFLTNEIADLVDDIENNLEILEQTEERIEVLIDEISSRMRVTQRVNNTNSFFTILSEAENLADFIRRARTFNRFATEDAEFMDELMDLIDLQENTLLQLEEQKDQLQEQTDQHEELRVEFEVEQESLEEDQLELIERETELQDRLYELNLNLVEEEELLDAIKEAEAVLSDMPPPVTRLSGSGSESIGSESSGQAPSARGLAHPMPGAFVTSEFGPRGGGLHTGIDLVIVGNPTAPILSAAAGTVTTNQWHGSLGWYVVVSHNINGQRVDTLYAHLHYQSSVKVGTVVAQGERIGTKGSTGNSSGPHLHFEVHPGGWAWGNSVNPRSWVGF